MKIMDEGGQLWDTQMNVGGAFVSYFSNLFTMGPVGDYSPCTQPIVSYVNATMNSELLWEFRVVMGIHSRGD